MREQYCCKARLYRHKDKITNTIDKPRYLFYTPETNYICIEEQMCYTDYCYSDYDFEGCTIDWGCIDYNIFWEATEVFKDIIQLGDVIQIDNINDDTYKLRKHETTNELEWIYIR